ncbi:MAG: hypothetical protein QOF36_1492 [Microbacteriaceae bacterium]|jgi:hypothetical protein|nr:hypothetical protein [Microbacteriaceae bacterium]
MAENVAQDVARDSRNSAPLRFLARTGFAVSGLIHILIGFIAFRVASGGGGEADQTGALGRVASTPGGAFVLWASTVGLAALGIWMILSAFLVSTGDPKKRTSRIVADLGKGVAYLIVAGTAFTFARGSSSSAARNSRQASAGLLAVPGGTAIVALIGFVVLGIGVYFVTKGIAKRFTRDIRVPSGTSGTAVVALGVFGYIAKGVALCVVGVLFAVAAFTFDPSKAAGLDSALKTLADLPFGQVILSVVGAGFVAYGLYSVARAFLARL